MGGIENQVCGLKGLSDDINQCLSPFCWLLLSLSLFGNRRSKEEGNDQVDSVQLVRVNNVKIICIVW